MFPTPRNCRSARWIAAPLAVLGLALPASAGAARVVPQGFLGVSAGGPLLTGTVPSERELPVMALNGVESLRFPFLWRDLQPYRRAAQVPIADRTRFRLERGVPTDFTFTDRVVAASARQGVELLPVVLGPPPWAARHPRDHYRSPPAGTFAYARFLRTLVERYGPTGSFWAEHPDVPRRPLRDWQAWNEPDHVFYWSDQPYHRDYVRLMRHARAEMKAADPGARLVLAGLVGRSWDQLDRIYRLGGRGAFDVAAVHPYTLRVSNVMRILRMFRATMRRHGDAHRRVRVTELTWVATLRRERPSRSGLETTPAGQATRLRTAVSLIARNRLALGVERVYWENWISTYRGRAPFEYAGLRRYAPSGVTSRPLLGVYRSVARALEGCAKTTVATRCR